jgi:hypothetical protein
LTEKVAYSRDRLETALTQVGAAMKKLAAIKDQMGLLTKRVSELKRIVNEKPEEPAPDPEPAPAPEPEPEPDAGAP